MNRVAVDGPGDGVAGAVLTGGASRRMGTDKAFVEVDGVALVRRVATALHGGGCRPVFAVGGDLGRLAAAGLEAVPDGRPGVGPLAGIVTALERARVPTVVVATDLVDLDASTIAALVRHAARDDLDVVVATSDRLEPLCALWWPSALEPLADRLAIGELAVHAALPALRVDVEQVRPDALTNANTPHDLGRSTR